MCAWMKLILLACSFYMSLTTLLVTRTHPIHKGHHVSYVQNVKTNFAAYMYM